MLRSTFSSVLGRRVVAAGLVAVSASLSACGDAATAPMARTGARPTNDLVITGPLDLAAYLTIHIVDVNGNNLPEAMPLHIVSYPGPTYMDVTDNGPGDLDATLGVVKVAIKKGDSYEACEMSGTLHYGWDVNNPTYPRCRNITSSALSIDMGKVYGRKKPWVTWYTKDEFGNLIWPATLKITIDNWTGSVTDGDGIMDGGLFGNISFPIQGGGEVVSWCETKAPYKYAPVTNKCGSFTAQWEKTYTFTIVHEKLIY